MSTYNIVASTNESTVVAEYVREASCVYEYQSETALEREFVRLLTAQGYEKLAIHSEAALIANLRRQLELLNGYTFSDVEWNRFFIECLASANEGIVEKTRKIQDDHVQILRRDDGSTKNIYLLDKKNIHNNRLQVINQYEESGGTHETRYDVTILVNGLPLVHMELKRRGVAIREAFNQISRYQRDSFWASSGLFEYAQVFVISMVLMPSITAIQQGTRISASKATCSARRARKRAIALSLPATGRTVTTKSLLILLTSPRHFSPSIPC